MTGPRSRTAALVIALAVGAVLFVGGALTLLKPQVSQPAQPASVARGGAGSRTSIPALEARAKAVPDDYVSLASLGLAYVEQARVTIDSSYYPKAEEVLRRSLEINAQDNYPACLGMAALAAGRHRFPEAKSWAEQGIQINGANSALYGVLSDAETQLGNYPAAFVAAQRMVDRYPDNASLARGTYTWELRGDLVQAEALMQRALKSAGTADDKAFAHYYLGQLAFDSGDFKTALREYEKGQATGSRYIPLLQGIAKVQAAMGKTDAAVRNYAKVVDLSPEPGWVIEYGELLESLGKQERAQEQYRLFEELTKQFEANGEKPDVDATLFYANHGQPERALAIAEENIQTRSFLMVQDSYAWSLHNIGRHAEALEWSRKARSLGMRNANLYYHAGMINLALGDKAAAEADLKTALEINPQFSPLRSRTARDTLAQLAAGR